jgi:DNA-binding NarL/FixJ family response regulator
VPRGTWAGPPRAQSAVGGPGHDAFSKRSFIEDRPAVYDARCAGASGFLLKDVTADRLLDAVRVVAAGEALVFPAILPAQRPPTSGKPPQSANYALF